MIELSEKQKQIAAIATDLFRELLSGHIAESVSDAEDTFQRDDAAPEPVVKIGVTVQFKPMNAKPEVTVRLSWTVKRCDEATAVVDSDQAKLAFASEGGAQ